MRRNSILARELQADRFGADVLQPYRGFSRYEHKSARMRNTLLLAEPNVYS